MSVEVVEVNDQYKFIKLYVPEVAANNKFMRDHSLSIAKDIRNSLSVDKEDITWEFYRYNLFNYSVGSYQLYTVFSSIVSGYKEYIKLLNVQAPKQLWMQAWINCHHDDSLLKTHNHQGRIHGYINIDPKKSRTIFPDDNGGDDLYVVENYVGLMYIGLGHMMHYVESEHIPESDTPRITIAFNISETIPVSHDPRSSIPFLI
jgi:hypothetical protein